MELQNTNTRRQWLKKTGTLVLGTLIYSSINACTDNEKKENKTLLVVSGWQDVNIGDIAHTPGLLNILETFLPDTKIILWKKSDATEAVKKLLKKNFPKVRVVYGSVDSEKQIDSKDVLDAFKEADILVHGSGPSVVGRDNLEAWHKATGKPFGIFGVTIQTINDSLKDLLSKASFIYTRETKSIEVLGEAGLSGSHISFVPDATFFMHIRDDEKADVFLKNNGLEEKKFICAIPRLRYTPYHTFRPNRANWTDERIKLVEETNEKYKEVDHAKLREAIIRWVGETGNKVLICPEMTYEIEIMDELLIDPLPNDVKPYVIKRGYWMPDEAASIYAKAHTILSFECHSPIISLFNGTPAFYLRQPEDTIKGHMYYDLGYDDWVFEIMDTEGKQIADQLMKVYADYTEAQKKIKSSNEQIHSIYASAIKVL